MTERYVISGASNTPAPQSQVSLSYVKWFKFQMSTLLVGCPALLVAGAYQCGQRANYHLQRRHFNSLDNVLKAR